MTEILVNGRAVEQMRVVVTEEGYLGFTFVFPDGRKETHGPFKEVH